MKTLKELRKSKNLTTTELAKLIHVSKRTIENYESGKTNPDYDTLKKLATFYNVTVDFVLGNENNVIFISEKEYQELLNVKKIIQNIEKRESIKNAQTYSTTNDNIQIGNNNTIKDSFNKK